MRKCAFRMPEFSGNMYKALAEKEPKVRFGGRLGEYKYYDMDAVIAAALAAARGDME